MEIKGTFKDGKMYRGNGRWAKVMVCKYSTLPSTISVAFGEQGELKAFHVSTFDLKPGYQKSMDESAKYYIDTSLISV